MITPEDIPGVSEDVARMIIVAARSIAPCIEFFPEGSEDKKNAVAILRGVAAEVPAPGGRRVRSQRIGPAAVEYRDAESWSVEDRRLLRSLCPAVSPGGLPVGSFPDGSKIRRVWPEGGYL